MVRGYCSATMLQHGGHMLLGQTVRSSQCYQATLGSARLSGARAVSSACSQGPPCASKMSASSCPSAHSGVCSAPANARSSAGCRGGGANAASRPKRTDSAGPPRFAWRRARLVRCAAGRRRQAAQAPADACAPSASETRVKAWPQVMRQGPSS